MYLDIFVVLVLLLSIILGIKNGLFVEFLTIFGFVASFFLSKRITPAILKKVDIGTDESTYLLSYIAIFLICLVFVTVLMHFLKRIFNGENKGGLIRLLGGIIGVARGLLLSGIALIAINMVADVVPAVKEYVQESKSNEIFFNVLPNLGKYLPNSVVEKLNEIHNKEIVDDKLSRA